MRLGIASDHNKKFIRKERSPTPFLCPIANLRVVGKLNCELMCELLCKLTDATDRHRQYAECTGRVFKTYRVADFDGCLKAAEEMEHLFGASKFLKLYTWLSNERVAGTASSQLCDGEISLTEK